jgi:glycosyltransferase involved in cell wall biosynthesis
MNILWVVNTLMKDVKEKLGLNNIYGGGWLEGYLEQFRKQDFNVSIVVPYECDEIIRYNVDNFVYYLIPGGEMAKNGEKEIECGIWKHILNIEKPDIIHIHGTEYAHSISLLEMEIEIPTVVSIQGLLTNYARYYYAGIDYKDLLYSITLKDVIRKNTIFNQKKNFIRRSYSEKKIISLTNAIIGRTDWDYSNVKEIKRDLKYYKCNESLRNIFYEAKKWDINRVEEYTIFISQATYPIKGFHNVLKAINILKYKYKSIKVYVAGSDIGKNTGIFRGNGYSRYINSLIHKYDLEDHVEYLGVLDEYQMASRLVKTHIFVQASAIENSPNSLGEAQILGVPCISSFVGGVSNMVSNFETGLLFNYQEYSILASYIDMLFSDPELAKQLSKQSIIEAENRHDRTTNGDRLIEIYEDLTESRLL